MIKVNGIPKKENKEKVLATNIPAGQAFLGSIYAQDQPKLFLRAFSSVIDLSDPSSDWTNVTGDGRESVGFYGYTPVNIEINITAGLTPRYGVKVINATVSCQKIAAIKAVREICNIGLKEAKDIIETCNPTIETSTAEKAIKLFHQLDACGYNCRILDSKGT